MGVGELTLIFVDCCCSSLLGFGCW